MAGSTVQANSIYNVIGAARRAGLDVPALLAAVNLDPALLDGPDARVPYKVLADLYEHAARLTNDDAFGARVGLGFKPVNFDVLGHAVMSCRDLEQAFATITRYLRVLQDGAEVRLERSGQRARVTYTLTDPSAGPHRHETEASIGIVFSFLDETLGGEFRPQEVSFVHAAPASASELARLFRGPVRFGANANALWFDASLLATPMPGANATLSAILERHIVDIIAKLPTRGDLATDVRAAIARMLEKGEPPIGAVARALAISTRTLQRRLREAGTTFADILDDVRRELALRYLADREHGVSDIAFLLGYGDLTTFHRAFRRWTGMPPGEWRRRQER